MFGFKYLTVFAPRPRPWPSSPKIRAKQKRAAKLGLKDAGKAGGASGSGSGAGGLSSPRVSPGAFSSTQRDQTLEMLLSRERVLSLLYAKVLTGTYVCLVFVVLHAKVLRIYLKYCFISVLSPEDAPFINGSVEKLKRCLRKALGAARKASTAAVFVDGPGQPATRERATHRFRLLSRFLPGVP